MKNSSETLRKRTEQKNYWKRITPVGSFPPQEEKKCKDCGKTVLCDWNSSFTQTGNPEYKARCPECHKVWQNALRRRPKYKQLRNSRRKETGQKRKAEAVNRLGGKCMDCGYDKYLGALTFHHRNPSEKVFEISSNAFADKKPEDIEKELRKCDLLCFNCHMEKGR